MKSSHFTTMFRMMCVWKEYLVWVRVRVRVRKCEQCCPHHLYSSSSLFYKARLRIGGASSSMHCGSLSPVSHFDVSVVQLCCGLGSGGDVY